MITLADISRRLDTVRRKERSVILVTGLARTILSVVAAALAYFLLDWLFEMPYAGRIVTLLMAFGAIGCVFFQHVLKPLRRIADDDEIALRVEARNPDLRGRLISTVQLSRSQARGEYAGSPDLLRALESDTLAAAQPLDFLRIISKQTMRKIFALAGAALLIQIVCVVRFPDYFEALALRLVHPRYQYPTKTRIEEVLPPSTYVAYGDPVHVTVRIDATSVVPEENGLLTFRLDDGTETPVELVPSPDDPTLFEGKLAKALGNMKVVAEVGDARSMPMDIEVRQRPEVREGSIRYIYPAYTGRKTSEPQKFGGLKALVGSSAEITITASKTLKSAQILRADGQKLALVQAGDDKREWKLPKPFLIDRSTNFSVEMVDEDGLANPRPAVVYPVDAQADEAPSVKLRWPSRDTIVTAKARKEILFDVSDDFGVRTVWLLYKVTKKGQAEESAKAKRKELTGLIDEKRPKSGGAETLPCQITWALEQESLNVEDQIVFWLEADDDCATNDVLAAPAAPADAEVEGTGTGEPKAEAKGEIAYPRSTDVRFTVVSEETYREERLENISEFIEQTRGLREQQENVKRRVLKILEESDKK